MGQPEGQPTTDDSARREAPTPTVHPPGVTRERVTREARASCRDCGWFAADAWALAHGVRHVKETGHTVTGKGAR